MLHLPALFEAAIGLLLTERRRLADDFAEARHPIVRVVEDHPGPVGMGLLERDFTDDKGMNSRAVLLPAPANAGGPA